MPRWYAGGDTARRAYYDRDPIPVFCAYTGIVGPHGTVIRAQYTPPVGYAAFIENQLIAMVRQVVATTPVNYACYLEFLPFYGGVIRQAYITSNYNGQYAMYSDRSSGLGYMAYGDVIRVLTGDGSIGGLVEFVTCIKGTEFLY